MIDYIVKTRGGRLLVGYFIPSLSIDKPDILEEKIFNSPEEFVKFLMEFFKGDDLWK